MFIVCVWLLSARRMSSRSINSFIMAEQFSSLSLGTFLWHLYHMFSLSTRPYINVNIIVYILGCSHIVTLTIMRQWVLESLVSVSILLYGHWVMY